MDDELGSKSMDTRINFLFQQTTEAFTKQTSKTERKYLVLRIVNYIILLALCAHFFSSMISIRCMATFSNGLWIGYILIISLVLLAMVFVHCFYTVEYMVNRRKLSESYIPLITVCVFMFFFRFKLLFK